MDTCYCMIRKRRLIDGVVSSQFSCLIKSLLTRTSVNDGISDFGLFSANNNQQLLRNVIKYINERLRERY